MDELLALAASAPRRSFTTGDVLVPVQSTIGSLFVLLDGTLRVERDGVPIATISEPGACVGEMALLLGVPATADVVAASDGTVATIDDAAALLRDDPTLALALARMLARRLQTMNTYLVDLKQQYADHEGGLGMLDTVLGALSQSTTRGSTLGSARDPDPEY